MSSRFVQSASRGDGLPDLALPEVAFIGRSNVGKSSLLGMLLGQPKLVRVSKTPGRTQLLNLFVLNEKLAVVDLPGYGYAKLPKSQRQKMDAMVQGYLRERKILRVVILVVDARRDPVSEYDKFVVGWIREIDRPMIVAVTKSDTVAKNRQKQRADSVARQLDLPGESAILCSAKLGTGRKELLRRIVELST